ncbi:MAG: glutamate racemase [Candidatus Andersenbacteria bacterium]|nr:glutamate racemase [Candidatus Andersenbacteria bacterium]
MIGIFDSGYGGLTILDACKKALPEYSYIYVGDNAHAPYGPKTDEEIFALTKQGVEQLFQKGCNLVILACNTASASALRRLQQEWLPSAHPDKKVLGIIVPTAEAVSNHEYKTIGILATQHTVATGVYEKEIQKRNSSISITDQACNNLAGMIEQYGVDDEWVSLEIAQCVHQLLEKTPNPDAVLLGCTHYELIAEKIQRLLPEKTALIRQQKLVAQSLKNYLERHPELEPHLQKTGTCQYFTTGNPQEVSQKSSSLMGDEVVFQLL